MVKLLPQPGVDDLRSWDSCSGAARPGRGPEEVRDLVGSHLGGRLDRSEERLEAEVSEDTSDLCQAL